MKEKTVLLVEDNADTMNINRTALTMRGWRVLEASTLWEAYDVLECEAPDAIVLDVMLPDGSGLDFCRRLEQKKIPVLFLTALGGKANELQGLLAGGDDYLSKPYDLDILVARLAALLRRSRFATRQVPHAFDIGPLSFDVIASNAFWDLQDLQLTQKEFALLFALSQNAGQTMSAQKLYESVWGKSMNDDGSVLRRHISSLRKKLNYTCGMLTLSTLRDEGYRLNVTVPSGGGETGDKI